MTSSSKGTPCSGLVCPRPGLFRCIRCRDAVPPTVYCSEKCQRSDWKFHRAFCSKDAYTFDLVLVGSTNPVIKRTFDIPAWYTFEILHYAVQYAMGPWFNEQNHSFSFRKSVRDANGRQRKETVLDIIPAEPHRRATGRNASGELESELKISDVFEREGRCYSKTLRGSPGNFWPLTYLYGKGVGGSLEFWECELTFKGKKLARADRALFSLAQGCAPIETLPTMSEWHKIKSAFRAAPSSRTRAQKEMVEWAQSASGQDERYEPLKDPNVVQMNYEGRWENHIRGYQGLSDEEFPEDSDFNDDFSGDSDEENEIVHMTGLAIAQDDWQENENENFHMTGLAIAPDDLQEEMEYSGFAVEIGRR